MLWFAGQKTLKISYMLKDIFYVLFWLFVDPLIRLKTKLIVNCMGFPFTFSLAWE